MKGNSTVSHSQFGLESEEQDLKSVRYNYNDEVDSKTLQIYEKLKMKISKQFQKEDDIAPKKKQKHEIESEHILNHRLQKSTPNIIMIKQPQNLDFIKQKGPRIKRSSTNYHKRLNGLS